MPSPIRSPAVRRVAWDRFWQTVLAMDDVGQPAAAVADASADDAARRPDQDSASPVIEHGANSTS